MEEKLMHRMIPVLALSFGLVASVAAQDSAVRSRRWLRYLIRYREGPSINAD
jgi:hypothetical protein